MYLLLFIKYVVRAVRMSFWSLLFEHLLIITLNSYYFFYLCSHMDRLLCIDINDNFDELELFYHHFLFVGDLINFILLLLDW